MKNISKNVPPQIKKSIKIISLFESVKKKSKKLLRLQGNAKQAWKVMKEIIGKAKLRHMSYLPQKITVNKINLFDKAKIESEFNKFFENIGIELASKIPTAKTTIKTY